MIGNFSRELLEKASKAKTKQEALEILKNSGVILTDDDLQKIAGGENDQLCWKNCPVYDICPYYEWV